LSGEKTLRILVADDNEINQTVIRGMLEHAGYQVDTVPNGDRAVKALEHVRYDLVIMDCLMPVMDGFTATRNIRAASPSRLDPNVLILAITALATPEDRWRCLDAGMSGYISKPVVAKDLFDWVAEHVYTSPQAGDHRQHSQPVPGNKTTETKNGSQAISPAHLTSAMSRLLVRDAEQWQRELRTHCVANRLEELSALAHKIRGTADILGYTGLSAIAAKLEQSGKAGCAGDAASLVNLIIEALRQLIHEIKSGS
jgi:CheY-like chemotaxis protein